MDVPEHVPVVDFARSGLISAGIVPDLEVGNFVPGRINVGDQVPLGDLLVVDVVQDFAGRTRHGLADQVGLGSGGQKHAGVVPECVERLQDHDQAVGLKNRGGTFEGVHDPGRLEVDMGPAVHVARHHRHPLRADTFGDLD